MSHSPKFWPAVKSTACTLFSTRPSAMFSMFRFFRLWLGLLALCFRSHRTLLSKNLALRQQLTVLKRRHPKPEISPLDKVFWVSARRFWSAWIRSLIIVTPETVVCWDRVGFRWYWSLISRVKERVERRKHLPPFARKQTIAQGGEHRRDDRTSADHNNERCCRPVRLASMAP